MNIEIVRRETNKYNDAMVIFPNESWNDYNFRLRFSCCYYKKSGDRVYIGDIRILPTKITGNKLFSLIVDADNRNDESISFCSLGLKLSFYRKLYKIVGKENYEYFLNYINDFSSGKVSLAEIKKEILKNSEDYDINEQIEHYSNYMVLDLDDFFQKTILRDDCKYLYELSKLLHELKLDYSLGRLNFKNLINSEKFADHIEDFTKLLANVNQSSSNLKDQVEQFNIDDKSLTSSQKDTIKSFYRSLENEFASYTDLVNCIDAKLNTNTSNCSLGKIVKNIKEMLRVNEIDEDKKVCQYTSVETLRYVVVSKKDILPNDDFRTFSRRNGRLRLTNIKHMNDPSEGKVLIDMINRREASVNMEDYVGSTTFVSSASDKVDDLTMWRGYTENGNGICLIYNNDYLKKIISAKNIDIYSICYVDMREYTKKKFLSLTTSNDKVDIDNLKENVEHLIEYFRKSNDKQNDLEQLGEIRYLFKNIDYKDESEYRILLNEQNKDHIFFDNNTKCKIPFLYTYLDMDDDKYDEIILGPNTADIDYIAPYVKYCNNNIRIHPSTIEYRN